MFDAVISMTVLGSGLGLILGFAARRLAVETDPLEAELEALLPGSQCGQCGFAGCRQAAAAVAAGNAEVTVCPPGGVMVASAIADKLGVPFDPSAAEEPEPKIAFINEKLCIGCTRCINVCTTDAIVGAAKQMHTVVADACHGCGKCVAECPTEGIRLRPVPDTLETWHWHKPAQQPKPAPHAAWHWRRLKWTPRHTLGNKPVTMPKDATPTGKEATR